ncbi:ferritin [bacterium]|nr:ferritin [bacterium]
MLSRKMTDALNGQINKELYSAYLYLAMSAWAENKGFKGFANWFHIQYQEETVHAMKIYHYLQEQGAAVALDAIQKPPSEFKTLLSAFEETLKHEQFITRSIHELVELALSEKDYATSIFLQWFVTEQVEEEANDNEIIGKLQMVGDKGHGLFMMDRELGGRKFEED